ncbi:zinc finger protein 665-like [Sitophilus oryzae]|uniref:Zinc finger protein 665-like n=1 Tax=Sitophilus oryzae TaxID=7048 RepID=A0A6J2XQN2_SITOR|nr:zinc finger protein 665-like [Sitophilus oryzae]
MYLQRSYCVLCSEHISNIQYNLKTTNSEKSNILLIKFVEEIYKNVFLTHCNICHNCYDLLNELDTIQVREKELFDKLKSYVAQVEKLSQPTSLDIKEEDVDDDNLDNCSLKSEPEFVLEGVNLNKLPIKIKRVPSKKSSTGKRQNRVIENSDDDDDNDADDDKDAFEKVQSLIKIELSKHKSTRKSKVAKDILCEMCGQSFKTRFKYEKHLIMHDDTYVSTAVNHRQEWLCHVCQKVFTQKVSLKRHLFIHSGQSRYQCEQCGKKFVHHSSFDVHKKIHAGLRNYQCNLCEKKFYMNSHLTRHMRATHMNIKDYECPTCGKEFAENYNLIAHMKLHKTEGNHLYVPSTDMNI